jgi:formylglycine-generating enzyme required for sulfatase activity
MFEKKARSAAGTRENSGEDEVRLSPVLGLRPGVFLTLLYSLIILILLFFLFFVPGLLRPGSMVVLKTSPAGAALRVDGVYRGTSPGRIFVPRGLHWFELVLPGFQPSVFEEDIGSRLAGSLFFPRLHRVEKQLSPAAGAPEILALGAAEYAAWSFAGEPTAAFQIPLRLSEGAYRAGPGAETGSGGMNGVLRAASRFGSTRAALRDLIRAKALIDNRGLSPSPGSLFRSAGDLIGFLSETPGAAPWLADTLPPEAASLIAGSAWYQKQVLEGENIKAAEQLPPGPAGRFRLDSLSFTTIPGGILAQAAPFPRQISIGEFRICDTEIPPAAFGAFLAAQPQWNRDNLENLLEQNLVTGEYLSGGFESPEENSGISQVSWYAARAFCSWLSDRLPPSMESWEVRLPTEAEWEYAAKAVQNWGASDISGLSGGGWEWCGDPYAPLDFIEAPAEAREAAGSPERSLRGGAWINPGAPVRPETRASLPPKSCSPLVSFRPVIARKNAAPGVSR